MRFLSFVPFFRTRRAKTFKIRRIRRNHPALFVKFHIAAALALLGLLAGIFALFGLAEGVALLEQSRAFANPTLLGMLFTAHTCVMFTLNRNAH